jgi:site-specific recombinase XerD
MFKNQYRAARFGFCREESLKNLTTAEIGARFSDWLICQRYSKVTLGNYNRVLRKFLSFWGNKRPSLVTHLDVRAFLIEVSKRDLSADVMHRYIWGLRCFFDFLSLLKRI